MLVKLFRLIWLVAQSIFLLFLHLVGLVAFAVAVVVGYFRLPSWWVPVLGVVFGVITERYVEVTDVTGILEKAAAANGRGGFLILAYLVIVLVGYLVGAYARNKHEKHKRAAAAPAKE